MTIAHTDLSDRLGSMLVKELRQSLRRSSFIIPFVLIHLFAIAAVISEFKLDLSSGGSRAAVFFWNPDHIGPFWWVVLAICSFIMPMAGFILMPQEIEEGNHELLQLTILNRWQVVFGKFLTLWLLSLLTLTSLLPYIIIRYFIGGIEWFNELANIGTVIAVAAIIAALSIGASGFGRLAAKIGAFCILLFSAVTGGGISLIGGAILLEVSEFKKWALVAIIFYHLSVFIVVICYVIMGLLVARSRLRLAVMNFEIKPTSLLIVIIGLGPFIIGMVAAFTCGFGSILGVMLLTFLAWNSDRTPKAPKWMATPNANVPKPPLPAATPMVGSPVQALEQPSELEPRPETQPFSQPEELAPIENQRAND